MIKTKFLGSAIIFPRKGGSKMENKTVVSIETVIDYIEANLDGKLDLETVAEAVMLEYK